MNAVSIAVSMVVILWAAVLTVLIAWTIVRFYRARWRQRIITVAAPVFTPCMVGQSLAMPEGRYVVHEIRVRHHRGHHPRTR